MAEWNSEYQEVPPPSRTDLYLLAEEYHERTESYDRRVCTGPVLNDSIQPATSHERALTNENALQVRRELLAKAIGLGYTEKEFQAAIVRASNYSQ